jgi:hypothetical protein
MHVGLQYRGVNAFEHMLEVAPAVQALRHEVEQKPIFNIHPEQARRSILIMGGECERVVISTWSPGPVLLQ